MESKEKVKDLFKDKESRDLVIQWLQGKSEKTRQFYLIYFVKFCNYARKSPRQLLEDRAQDYAQIEGESPTDALLRRKRGEREFQRVFKEIEKNEGLAARTISTIRSVVKSFYSYVGYPLNKTDTPYRKSRQRKFHDVELAESDYKAIVDAGDMKEKLRVVWLAQSGMRLGDVQRIKVRDLTEFDLEKLEALKVPMAIDYLPEKTEGRDIGERYTFIGEYGVELLKAELRGRVENDGIETVREQYIFPGQEGTELSAQQWNSMLKDLAKKAGLRLDGEHGRIRAYCLRKYFDSQLQGHNVNKNVVYWMMGHGLEGQEESYFQGQVQKENLRNIYAGIQQYLTPMKTQVVEKVVQKAVIPVEVYDEMNDLKKAYKELRADFDKMIAYMTEEGKKRIFGKEE